jgi:hypothetical protein
MSRTHKVVFLTKHAEVAVARLVESNSTRCEIKRVLDLTMCL